MGGTGYQPVFGGNLPPKGPAAEDSFQTRSQSVSENSAGSCFRAKGRMARRNEGEYPPWIFD